MTVFSGRKCCASLRKQSRPGLLLKMLLESSTWHSDKCYLTWRAVDTISPETPKDFPSFRLYRLQQSTPPTEGIGSGLLHTPSEQESGVTTGRLITKDGDPAKIGERAYDKESGRLAQVGLTQQLGMLTTPVGSDTGRKTRYKQGGTALSAQVAMLQTPRTSDSNTPSKSRRKEKIQLREQIDRMIPTPQNRDWKGAVSAKRTAEKIAEGKRAHLGSLDNFVAFQGAMLPTPRVSETEGAPVTNAECRNGKWSRKNKAGVRWGVKVKDVLASVMIPTPTECDYKSRGPNSKQIGIDNLMKLLPAPTTETDIAPIATNGIRNPPGISPQMGNAPTASEMLPTPRAGTPGSRPNQKGGKILAEEVKKAGMIPTPKAQSSRAACEHGDGGPDLQTTVGKAPGLKLHPDFVCWMMNYPVDWLDISEPPKPISKSETSTESKS